MFFVFSIAASADVINFSSGSDAATSSTGNVYLITPDPVWGSISGAQWVSAYPNTGYNGTVLPNSSGVGFPTMTFFLSFILPYEINTGSITVGADDTMAVSLNGTLLKAANWALDEHCAAGQVGCQTGEFATLALNSSLVQGNNVLQMDVYQRAGFGSGAIWSGGVTSESSVPEPATYSMFGLGLIAIGAIRRYVLKR